MSLPFTCFTGKLAQVRMPTLWPALLLVVYHYPAFKSNCLESAVHFTFGASHLPESSDRRGRRFREGLPASLPFCSDLFRSII